MVRCCLHCRAMAAWPRRCFKMCLGNRHRLQARRRHDHRRAVRTMLRLHRGWSWTPTPAARLADAAGRDHRRTTRFECCGDKLDIGSSCRRSGRASLGARLSRTVKAGPAAEKITARLSPRQPAAHHSIGVGTSRSVIIPVFPGTNCEYDTARAFAQRRCRAGDAGHQQPDRPRPSPRACEALVKAISESQIVMLPGGFSGGDEPDGSGEVHHGLLPRSRGHRGGRATCCSTATA